MKTFNFYSDPGHGWLEVDFSDLKALGLVDWISPYSRRTSDGLKAYLEEDCDATLFIRRAKNIGMKFEIKEYHLNAPAEFRTLPPYHSTKTAKQREDFRRKVFAKR